MLHQVIDFLQVFLYLLSSVPYLLVHQRSLQTALFALFHFHGPSIILVPSSNVFPWVFSGLFPVMDYKINELFEGKKFKRNKYLQQVFINPILNKKYFLYNWNRRLQNKSNLMYAQRQQIYDFSRTQQRRSNQPFNNIPIPRDQYQQRRSNEPSNNITIPRDQYQQLLQQREQRKKLLAQKKQDEQKCKSLTQHFLNIFRALKNKDFKTAFQSVRSLAFGLLIPQPLRYLYNTIKEYFKGNNKNDGNGQNGSSGNGQNGSSGNGQNGNSGSSDWWHILLIILLMVAIGLYFTCGTELLQLAKTFIFQYINWETAEKALSSFCQGPGSLVNSAFKWIGNLFN